MKKIVISPFRSLKKNLAILVKGVPGHPEFIINHKKKYAYLVNSKAACTSIKASLIEDITGCKVPDGINPHNCETPPGVRVFGRANIPKDYFVFTFVREPVHRLTSLYQNKFRTPEEIFNYGFLYQDYFGSFFKINDSFETFVDKVCDIPDRLADRHFVSQKFLVEKSGADVNCFKLEEIAKKFGEISQNYDLPKLKKMNKSNKATDFHFEMNESIESKLRCRYKDDYNFFDY